MADTSRPQMFLFGCTLSSAKREHKVEIDDDDETEQQLSLKAVCLGAEAEDKFHVVEVEGLTFDGKTTTVPLAALKPSVLPSVTLGGFEITPPVTFRLQSGSGPVYISGQHFVGVKETEEDEDEEENNTSPVKRPAGLSGKRPPLKKLKMDSDEDSDEDDEDDDEDDDGSDENDMKLMKPPKSDLKKQFSGKKPNKSPEKSKDFAGKLGLGSKPHSKAPASGKDKGQAGTSRSLSVAELKSKLSAAVKEGKPLPKTEQKLENYVKSAFKVTDKNMVKELWKHVQTLRTSSK